MEMPELHVSGELGDFFRSVGRSHETIHAAELEERWTAEAPRRNYATYDQFRSTPAYDGWKKAAELDLTSFRSRALEDVTRLADFRTLELKLKPKALVSELGGSTKPEVADFVRALRNPTNPQGDGFKALAAEAQAIADKAAGKKPQLGDEVLTYIADQRAVVQRRGMHLTTHLDTLVTAAINEINTTLGRPHGDTQTADATALLDATTSVREALQEWYAALDRTPFPGDEQELLNRAKDVAYRLGGLGKKGEDIAFSLRNRNPANSEPEAPLLKGGLELQASLMAREIADQLATRAATATFTAVYRIANERPAPPGGLGTAEKTLVDNMRSNTDRASFDWARESVKELTAAKKKGLDPGRADAITSTVQGAANALELWMKAVQGAPQTGPGEIRAAAGELMRQLRTLERAVVDAKIPEPHAGKLGALSDAAVAYVRSDAMNAMNLLGG
jgi:hypothetical protein